MINAVGGASFSAALDCIREKKAQWLSFYSQRFFFDGAYTFCVRRDAGSILVYYELVNVSYIGRSARRISHTEQFSTKTVSHSLCHKSIGN